MIDGRLLLTLTDELIARNLLVRGGDTMQRKRLLAITAMMRHAQNEKGMSFAEAESLALCAAQQRADILVLDEDC